VVVWEMERRTVRVSDCPPANRCFPARLMQQASNESSPCRRAQITVCGILARIRDARRDCPGFVVYVLCAECL
jgi:hypothetical protein